MAKKINQMAVRFRSLADGDDVAFKWESSLDKILTAGNYAVEIEHYGADVGLPIEGCGTEHSIVGTLVVTDSGALDNKQGDRVMGQVLTFTLRESKETSIYTRTYAGGEWGEWCSLARTGMYDEIANPDELYSTVSSLVSTTKELEDNLIYGIKQVVDADKVQISTTNEDGSVKDTLEIPAVTIKKAGVMTAADKAKLNNDVPYPQKTGTMVTSADKKYIYRGSGDTDVVAGLYWQAWQKTVDLRVKKWGMSTNDEVGVLSMPAATSEKAGVMTAEDKKKLDDNVVALVAETARAQSAEAAAIEQGRKLALRDLFIAAGAVYDSNTSLYSLNGVNDLSEQDIKISYNYKEVVYHLGAARILQNVAIRAFYPRRGSNMGQLFVGNTSVNGLYSFASTNIEVFKLGTSANLETTNADNIPQCTSFYGMFYGCTKLHTVYPLNLLNVTSVGSDTFKNCIALKVLRLYKLHNDLPLSDSPLIDKESILYIINNSAPTSVITITLHASAYAYLAEDADVVVALGAQPLITLVSA